MKKGDVILNDTNKIKATVKWVVDNELGVLFENGESAILDFSVDGMKETWKIIHESTPVYQTSIEHMTDDQLRNSIEELRRKRLSRPEVSRVKKAGAVRIVQTEEDKQLAGLLKGKSESDILALKRKLGLID